MQKGQPEAKKDKCLFQVYQHLHFWRDCIMKYCKAKDSGQGAGTKECATTQVIKGIAVILRYSNLPR